ncbi:claudin-34 [Xenopus laevis]|uniref:Claudin-34 n=2 Tax=Xenopus laevis TaxID=8355 RepID=A0A1L8HF26_XENLA|nr:claudin-34 [Xenopus laevis]OCT94685.1 hypothetical protein XELAEV_18012371mg [Xenopus laevis]
MPYLAHTANLQLAGFAFATVGWILGSITTGLVQWRVWYVSNTTIISSGIAWIGIWRTCFFSDLLVSPDQKVMYCQEFNVQDSFVPREIFVAQGLMIVAIILGAAGKAFCVFGLKNVYQGRPNVTVIPRRFIAGGVLTMLSSVCIIIPVAWNLHSVVNNFSIYFPSSYDMPSSPEKQEVGAAIAVGIVSAILLFISGAFFLSYKLPYHMDPRVFPLSSGDILCDGLSFATSGTSRTRSIASRRSSNHILNCDGIPNGAFELDEKL